MFRDGSDVPEIVKAKYSDGKSAGRAYTEALRKVNRILRTQLHSS